MTAHWVEEFGNLDPIPSGTEGIAPSVGSFLQTIWKGDIFAVKELLENGVDPNVQTKLGESPLHIAAKKEETEVTILLIAHGADTNSREGDGKTPLMEAASAGQPENAEVLLSAGADINATDENGFTALIWATMLGFPELVGILIEYGAEVNTRSKDGMTAMGISQKLVDNAAKNLKRAFKSNSDVPELQIKLANQKEILQLLKEAGRSE